MIVQGEQSTRTPGVLDSDGENERFNARNTQLYRFLDNFCFCSCVCMVCLRDRVSLSPSPILRNRLVLSLVLRSQRQRYGRGLTPKHGLHRVATMPAAFGSPVGFCIVFCCGLLCFRVVVVPLFIQCLICFLPDSFSLSLRTGPSPRCLRINLA